MSNEIVISGQNHAPSVAEMLKAVVDKGISSADVGALEKLVGLYERMESKDAEKKFASAFVKFQAEAPIIIADSVIPNRGKYAKFERIMQVISPLLLRHGFSISFSNECVENRVIETCHLRHVAGHSQSNSFAVRVGKADNDCQSDCKAATTAKRQALMNALNIVVAQDCMTQEQDAALEGDIYEYVTKEQAQELERRVSETNTDKSAFLKFAKAEKFATIQASRYTELDTQLARKEKQGR